MKILLSFITVCLLCSCGQSHYSPLDTYLDARIKGDSLNEVSRIKAQQYIDSVKGAHIVIHMSKY